VRSPLGLARALALLAPAALLAGAYGFQYVWARLYPCEMCWWQRYAHMAALGFAILALLLAGRLPDRGRSFVWLAALAIAASGAIGFYHAGVELRYFPGFTQCDSTGAKTLAEIMAAPVVRCDQIQWQWLGISMAGWNAILSLGSALVILWLSLKRPRPL
jgi:disulfide bond formation protein DsbB